MPIEWPQYGWELEGSWLVLRAATNSSAECYGAKLMIRGDRIESIQCFTDWPDIRYVLKTETGAEYRWRCSKPRPMGGLIDKILRL